MFAAHTCFMCRLVFLQNIQVGPTASVDKLQGQTLNYLSLWLDQTFSTQFIETEHKSIFNYVSDAALAHVTTDSNEAAFQRFVVVMFLSFK